MAWGGGMFGGAGGGGGGMQPPGTHSGNPGGGLPFAGIPSELQAGVEKLLAREPGYDTPDPNFSYRAKESGVTLRRMLGAHKRTLSIAIVLVVIEALMLQAGPLLTQIGIDRGIGRDDWGVLLAAAVGATACVGITIVASRFRVSYTGRFSARIMTDLRIRVFAHLQRLSLDYYTKEKAGVIMTRMTSDIEALQQMLQEGLVQFAVQGLTMLVVTTILFVYDVKLALITLVLIVPPLTVLSLWFRRESDRGYNRVRDGIAAVLSDLSESLSGVRVVAGFNRMRHNVVNHRNVVGEYRDANDHTAHLAASYGAGSEVIGFLGQGALLLIGGSMVRSGSLTVGQLVAFILYVGAFFQPIQQLVQQYNLYQQGQAAISKLNDLLSTTPSVEEAEDAYDLPPIEGELELRDVTFGYDPAVPVLRRVNLHIAAGETVSFVGATGAGKSTIAKLVTRFYDPTSGSVLIDGHDLREISIPSLRRQLGVVPQEPFLFAGTIRDNVRFARPEATDEEIWEAVSRVGLSQLAEQLPEGLDTTVHERGVSLSSGERQLIALARAFLAGPRVLVLDEATSNLDLKSEKLVEAGLDAVLEGRTAIIVAHRLSTAMRADRIAVVDDGRIVELGTHGGLVAAGGRYAEMYEAWTAHLEGHDPEAEMVGAPATG